jgi:hypothetical protein
MHTEKSTAKDIVSAGIAVRPQSAEGVGAGGVYTVVCHDANGNMKWSDSFHNLVVNQGLQDMNSKYFSGAGYTAAWFLGLVTGPGSGTTFAAADTLASHAGWTENTAYTGTRKAATFGTATTADPSVINNAVATGGTPAVFTMSSNAQTIAGAFLCSVTSGTSGILFSAGDFTGGDKLVDSGDTLTVTYTFSLDAA